MLGVALWGAAAGRAPAGAPEFDPVRPQPVAIGPETYRVIVGFRATAGRASIKTVMPRRRGRSFTLVQAQTSAADATALAQRAGVAIAASRQVTPSMHVLFLPKMLYGAAVEAALAQLRADPAVRFAAADERRYALSATPPNDPLFAPTPGVAGGQWYLQTPSSSVMVEGVATMDLAATDAVSAWNLTTGSAGVVIADVDTGVRFDHPDLLRAGRGGRLLPGYDFVGQDYDATSGAALGTFLMANDGDGWDPDPSDPGDWITSADTANALFSNDPVESSSWHGTRVVGIFGAIANNATGIAGLTWGSWVLPVRALGKGGGYDSDIIAGIYWAAGFPVTNPDGSAVPANPYLADIINLSLGGSTDACAGSSYQTPLTDVTSAGVLVVVSAGNASGSVELPANCSSVVPGVMAVAGLRNVGTKVGYSSFGAGVSVSAPAGNCINPGPPCLRSIDTTTNLGTTAPGADSYTNETNYNAGTSFSAPIVSGIAALMRSVNNNLDPAQLAARLARSSTPFPQPAGVPICPASSASGECTCPNDGTQCGAGMVNALRAVQEAQKPIGVIVIPANLTPGSVIDASGSVAACDTSTPTPTPLGIAHYAWTAAPAGIIVGAANLAQVTVNPLAGVLTLTVTDSAGNSDVETVTFGANSAATSTAPANAGSSATACPTPLAVSAAAPTVAESFTPASVGENAVSTLTITFANSNGFALTQTSFAATLPANLSIAATPAPATDCTGNALSLTSTSNSIALSGANIPANADCTVTVPVKSAAAGNYTSLIGAQDLLTAPAGGNTASATATLTVTAPSGGGGGAFDGWDLLIAGGVLLGGTRRAVRRPMQ
jgi:serine protease